MMHPVKATAAVIGVVAALAVAIVTPLAIAAPAAQDAAPLLGYEIGEERRYVVGPEDALRAGEHVNWSIRLDRIETEERLRVGVFEIGHETVRRGIGNRGSMHVQWRYSGELRINEYGFPEEVRFSVFEEHTGEAPFRGDIMSSSFIFDGRYYQKEVRVPEQAWEFRVPISTHNDLDLDVPSGMFLFRPEAGLDLFTNPALLEFALPRLIPDTWEQRFLFFKPDIPVRYPNGEWAILQRDRPASLRRYYDKNTVRIGASMKLEIGGRTLNVRRLDISGPIRSAYVNELGHVVRIDIDPDPWTRNDRHIRMLFPSEY